MHQLPAAPAASSQQPAASDQQQAAAAASSLSAAASSSQPASQPACVWQFKGWPPAGGGSAIYASGIIVAPAQKRKAKAGAVAKTGAPVWGVATAATGKQAEETIPATQPDISDDEAENGAKEEPKDSLAAPSDAVSLATWSYLASLDHT